MTLFSSRDQLIDALKKAPKGNARAEILKNKQNRDLIFNSGANVTLVAGKIGDGKSYQEKFAPVSLGLIARLNGKTGVPDGIGATGGLSERIDKEDFNKLNIEQQEALIGLKDNVVRGEDNLPEYITDNDAICRNTVRRECFEELGNLGIYDYLPDTQVMVLTDMSDVRDDNYAINIWNGYGQVWAVTPYCYRLDVDEATIDRLQNAAQNNQHEENSEAKSYLKMPLFKALPRYGKLGGMYQTNDGRDMEYDFRYPHEWLNSWKIAADILQNNPADLQKLATEVQESVSHRLSFTKAAKDMGQDLNFVAKVLNVSAQTVRRMEGNFASSHLKSYQKHSQIEM